MTKLKVFLVRTRVAGISSVLLMSLALLFQNCGKVVMAPSDATSSIASSSTSPVLSPSASVNYVIVANTDVMNGVSAERVIPSGSSVYIRWTINQVAGTTGTPVVKLSYSLDDSTEVMIANGLADGSNSGCLVNGPGSADDNSTGCYVWNAGSPSSSYYRIRVSVSGLGDTPISGDSLPINASGIQFIAGATTNGVGASAANALLMNDMTTNSFQPDVQNVAVTTTGVMFFRDINLGIVTFSLTNPTLTVLIPSGATASGQGDGGTIANAKLRMPMAITVDSQDRLIILDYDRIRRVDLTNNTIQTIVGGGSNTADTMSDATQLQIQGTSSGLAYNLGDTLFPLRVLPNGDIFFFSENYSRYTNKRIRHYVAATKQVVSIWPNILAGSQAVFENWTTSSIANCGVSSIDITFDPTSASSTPTSLITSFSTYNQCGLTSNFWRYNHYQIDSITGVFQNVFADFASNNTDDVFAFPIEAKDGKMYRMERYPNARVERWDAASQSWTLILGTGSIGSCSEGTQATLCAFEPGGGFVDAAGNLYFVDRGRIRTIRNQKVVNVAGQGFGFGDGGQAINARFGALSSVQERNDGGLVVLDTIEDNLRQFYRGGLISTVAGNGGVTVQDTVDTATSQAMQTANGWDQYKNFAIDSVTNDIYYNIGGYTSGKLTNLSNLWQTSLGGGSTYYMNASATTKGTDIKIGAEPMSLLAYNGSKLLYGTTDWNGVNTLNPALFTVDKTTDAFKLLVSSTASASSTMCADGTPLTSCQTPIVSRSPMQLQGSYDSTTDAWLLMDSDRQSIRKVIDSQPMATLTKLGSAASAFVYHRFGKTQFVYYCRQSTGVLARRNLTTNTETDLPSPIATVKCAGTGFVYDSNNHSLVFIFTQNGLYGVAELFSVDPPTSEQ